MSLSKWRGELYVFTRAVIPTIHVTHMYFCTTHRRACWGQLMQINSKLKSKPYDYLHKTLPQRSEHEKRYSISTSNQREQGWRSLKSARPLASHHCDPGSIPGPGQICGSTLLREVFLFLLRFPPLLKNQSFQILIRSWNARTFQTSSCNINSWCSVGKQIKFPFF